MQGRSREEEAAEKSAPHSVGIQGHRCSSPFEFSQCVTYFVFVVKETSISHAGVYKYCSNCGFF